MPEIRLSGVQKPCSLRTGNMGKKTRAARSRTREKPSCRKILTLCKVPERGAPTPLPKQRGRAGPGRPDARRNKGRRTSCGRRSARPRRRKRPRTCGACPAVPGDAPMSKVRGKPPPGSVFQGNGDVADAERPQKKNARTPGCCNDARILPERARPGANGRRARKSSPHLAAKNSRKRTELRGQAACACAKKYRRGSAARPCPCVRARKPNAPAPKGAATHGERLPNAGQKSPAGPLLLQRNPAGRHP